VTNMQILSNRTLIPNWCGTCMRVWKLATKYSITFHQHEIIVGRKMLKLIKQISVLK